MMHIVEIVRIHKMVMSRIRVGHSTVGLTWYYLLILMKERETFCHGKRAGDCVHMAIVCYSILLWSFISYLTLKFASAQKKAFRLWVWMDILNSFYVKTPKISSPLSWWTLCNTDSGVQVKFKTLTRATRSFATMYHELNPSTAIMYHSICKDDLAYNSTV